jgi:hypothetical protein
MGLDTVITPTFACGEILLGNAIIKKLRMVKCRVCAKKFNRGIIQGRSKK